jgi:uncharacterized membrane protein YfcA
MTTAANTVAMLTFVIAGIVHWPATLALGLGALAGGYGGAHLGRKLPASIVRAGTIIFACAVTVVFFLRAYNCAIFPNVALCSASVRAALASATKMVR